MQAAIKSNEYVLTFILKDSRMAAILEFSLLSLVSHYLNISHYTDRQLRNRLSGIMRCIERVAKPPIVVRCMEHGRKKMIKHH